ncbi:MAG: uncharacterized protein A8A55_1915, partial [Amphiamblys sp. WSBS2006]
MENFREQTVFLQRTPLGRYNFVERAEGFLIIPNTPHESQEEVRAREESLFRLKQEVLEASGRTDADAVCMICRDDNSDGAFLFPICREAHYFACLGCLKKEAERGTGEIVCPHDREDPFAMTEYKRIYFELREAFLNRLTAQLTTHTPSEFLPTTTNIPNRPTLLTKKT